MSRGSFARLVALALMWGSSYLWIELSLDGLSPSQIVLARLTTGAAVLLLVVVLRRERLPGEPVVWAHLALLGVVNNIIPFTLFAWGQERITSGLAGVLNGSTPLWTLAFAVAALPEERLSRVRAAGLMVGFAGVVVVIGPWDQNPLTSSIPGQLACVGAAVCYGVGFVYTRRFLAGRGYRPLTLGAAQLLCAAVTMGALAPLVARTPVDPSLTVAASVLTLGVVGTGIAYAMFHRLIADAGATSTSMVTYLIPVVAVALGVVVLGEPVGWNLFAGAAIVLAGVMIAEGRIPGLRRPTLPASADGPPARDPR